MARIISIALFVVFLSACTGPASQAEAFPAPGSMPTVAIAQAATVEITLELLERISNDSITF